ncbi:hypothetical protein M758_6G105500 [Ceratodon purpureus]|uniref:Uncharacterized protein n=1 Tax=Ceratodon purpureus TaxID=3225 RepID=A0A8T0HIR0_CERPU|nr:hypothetical protein KC19_6G109300 [Ceratodon purpureus]KAG0613476.1 hypothetical protein M758_6G105500 [Ceratodon purpureus]
MGFSMLCFFRHMNLVLTIIIHSDCIQGLILSTLVHESELTRLIRTVPLKKDSISTMTISNESITNAEVRR